MTVFADLDPGAFDPPVTRLLETSPGGPRHVFVPSITRLRDGTLLVTSRWDAVGDAEGDATNEQTLLWSDDDGETWGGGDRAVVTIADGSEFELPSAITHSLVFEDTAGRAWLYYSINQPFTWGEGRPDRSTGGGELRRIRLRRDASGWRADGASSIVWGYRAPVGDGRGGTLDDVRIALEDKLVRTASGALLLAVGGRSTLDDPRGAFWRLNRCWVLESLDDGETWTSAHLIGGSDSLALAEPTIEVTADGTLVCLMRVQYGTGRELHRSISRDDGRTWSPPEPTGLPNAGEFGTKPFLQRIGDDRYALLVFSEPGDAGRTGASVYLTDSAGLLANRWPRKRTLLIERAGGTTAFGVGGYGWLAPDGAGGLISVLATQHGGTGRISLVRADGLHGAAVEPLAVRDDDGDHRPFLLDGVLRFPNARSRARDTAFAALEGYPRRVRLRFVVTRPPQRERFDLCRLDALHGRHPWLAVTLGPALGLEDALGHHTLDFAPTAGAAFELEVVVESARTATIRVDGRTLAAAFGAASDPPDLLTVGGDAAEPCEIDLLEAEYDAPSVLEGWA